MRITTRTFRALNRRLNLVTDLLVWTARPDLYKLCKAGTALDRLEGELASKYSMTHSDVAIFCFIHKHDMWPTDTKGLSAMAVDVIDMLDRWSAMLRLRTDAAPNVHVTTVPALFNSIDVLRSGEVPECARVDFERWATQLAPVVLKDLPNPMYTEVYTCVRAYLIESIKGAGYFLVNNTCDGLEIQIRQRVRCEKGCLDDKHKRLYDAMLRRECSAAYHTSVPHEIPKPLVTGRRGTQDAYILDTELNKALIEAARTPLQNVLYVTTLLKLPKTINGKKTIVPDRANRAIVPNPPAIDSVQPEPPTCVQPEPPTCVQPELPTCVQPELPTCVQPTTPVTAPSEVKPLLTMESKAQVDFAKVKHWLCVTCTEQAGTSAQVAYIRAQLPKDCILTLVNISESNWMEHNIWVDLIVALVSVDGVLQLLYDTKEVHNRITIINDVCCRLNKPCWQLKKPSLASVLQPMS